MGSEVLAAAVITMSSLFFLLATISGLGGAFASEFEVTGGGPMFNISLEGGCLKCGQSCLSAVESALPACVAPGLAVGGTIAGAGFDLSITSDVFRCVKVVVGALSACRECLESLVCCVTDSCEFCACDCHNLLQFSAPLSSPTREEFPWLFTPEVSKTCDLLLYSLVTVDIISLQEVTTTPKKVFSPFYLFTYFNIPQEHSPF